MKQILINIVFLSYIFIAFSILGIAGFCPFAFGYKDYPMWANCILYPLAIFIMASHRKIDKYFENKVDF